MLPIPAASIYAILSHMNKRSLFERANDLHIIVGKMRNVIHFYNLNGQEINLYDVDLENQKAILDDLKNKSVWSDIEVLKKVSQINYLKNTFPHLIINQMKEKIINNPHLLNELNDSQESVLNVSLSDKNILINLQSMLFSFNHEIDQNYQSPIPVFVSLLKDYNFTHRDDIDNPDYHLFTQYFYPVLNQTKMEKFIYNGEVYSRLLDLVAFDCLYHKINQHDVLNALLDLKSKYDYLENHQFDKIGLELYTVSQSQVTLDYIKCYEEKCHLENDNHEQVKKMKDLTLANYLSLKNNQNKTKNHKTSKL